ncbi:SPOR domain-containing protein [Bartonella raoultii]|uniref:SPOR domain-containing protein n=1 Tax=Bartonella raoultii TaxID=1457020 RepID=A0ABS7I458_9HYPH|nr:SPOR domain-containing protein [Bartonella raoultii]MBX4335536.1 SPOR domain-containing protein [Bartonella raoultii]
MSDNDRKNPHETKQDHEHHDPLARLRQIFNPNIQSKKQNDQSISQSSKPSFHDDDFDLSFLEAEFENNLTNNTSSDAQKKQEDLRVTSGVQTADATPTTIFDPSEQNNVLSEEDTSALIAHDEEQILDALSPLPIQKRQTAQKATTNNPDSFFEKSDFNPQLENFFFDESDRQINDKLQTEATEKNNYFSQTATHKSHTPDRQQNHDRNQNTYESPINHPYKVSADQENWIEEYYSDISNPSTETETFFSSSHPASKEKSTTENETTSTFPSSLDSTQANKTSDLANFAHESYTTDYPQFYEKNTLEEKKYAAKYHKEVASNQHNLNKKPSASEPLHTGQEKHSVSHNYTQRDSSPPNIDTYQFAEETVEKTGPIMVPEIPYEAPEYAVSTDGLKEEFADVLNVGSTHMESFSQQHQHNETFNEIFHQTTHSPKDEVYINSHEQSANYSPSANMEYDTSSFTENSPYRTTEKIPSHSSVISNLKNFIFGSFFAKIVVFLILIAIGFVGYSHFFMSSQKNGDTLIIHADNTPFKFKQEKTEAENDITSNLDIYNQEIEQNEKQDNTQQSLIDNSEQPEDLETLDQQGSTRISSSSLDESDVEHAVTEAINHTIPTQEVQTVVVNQDGTIVLSPHHTERKPTNEPEEIVDQASRGQTQNSSSISSQSSDKNNSKTEDNITNNIDKIIAENTSNSDIEEKTKLSFIPVPSYAKKNSELQTHVDTRSLPQSSETSVQNSEYYYVQLASQPTHALATDTLKHMKSRFGFLIGTRPVNIQSAFIAGKGTYYRVRIQTQNRNEAIILCQDIKSSGGSCFITR